MQAESATDIRIASPSRGLLREARCINVNTFGILPHRLGALPEMKPRNSASVVYLNHLV